MENILSTGFVLLGLLLVILFLRRLARQSRIKTSMYDHKSELEPTSITYVMGEDEMDKINPS